MNKRDLGPVALTRAWYHCAACGHGLAPRDAELGVAEEGMSPGLAAMNDRAAAAVPFKGAAGLLEDQMFFIPAYPLCSLTIIAVDVVALYGLCAYGSRQDLAA
jgi:hypothetical protein